MKQKTFGLATLLFIIISIFLYSNNSERIIDTEYKNLLSNTGKEIYTQIIYCESKNYYQVQKNQYIKFDKWGDVIEKGNFEDVYFHTYPESTKSAVLLITILSSIFYILSLYYIKQHSPFQKIKDHQIQKNKKSFLQLSEKERKSIINENPCMKCKADPTLKFMEEIEDKEWGITQICFHCERCEEVVKIRR
ncbi:MAG: hypothetical protein ACI94Y_001214 [Maribacter sp.]|jgi:hypothetical protein